MTSARSSNGHAGGEYGAASNMRRQSSKLVAFFEKKVPYSLLTMWRYLPRLSKAAQVLQCRRARSAGASESALEALMSPHARIEAPLLLGGHQTDPPKARRTKKSGASAVFGAPGSFSARFSKFSPPGGVCPTSVGLA